MITLERDPPSKREEQKKNDAAKGQAADRPDDEHNVRNVGVEEGDKSKLRALLKERVEILRENVERAKQLQEQGTAGPDVLWQANNRLYKAELELCENTKDRIAVLEKIANSYKQMEDRMTQLQKKGVTSQEEVREARLNRLEAEIALEREKAKLASPSK
jgi:outer membrane protein TolC